MIFVEGLGGVYVIRGGPNSRMKRFLAVPNSSWTRPPELDTGRVAGSHDCSSNLQHLQILL